MPKFSRASYDKLETCHPDLQILFKYVVEFFDCTILEGHRGKEAQDKAFKQKKSKLNWPNSRHNAVPSLAVDCLPYPAPKWENIQDFVYFGGVVKGVSEMLFKEGIIKHKIRYGGDWSKNDRISDENFQDYVHYEIYKP